MNSAIILFIDYSLLFTNILLLKVRNDVNLLNISKLRNGNSYRNTLYLSLLQSVTPFVTKCYHYFNK